MRVQLALLLAVPVLHLPGLRLQDEVPRPMQLLPRPGMVDAAGTVKMDDVVGTDGTAGKALWQCSEKYDR